MNFNEKCYELLKEIPKGKVTTYKAIAEALHTKAYRAVGNAMAKNKDLDTITCYKVLKSNGNIGNYLLGREKKIELLEKDGIEIINATKVNLQQYLYKFKTS